MGQVTLIMPSSNSTTAFVSALVRKKSNDNPEPKVEVKPVTGADIVKFLERKGYSSINEAVRDYC
jgi:hypothetical protein